MRCRDATPLLSAALDGELDPGDARRLDEHVVACSRCTRERAAYETMRARLRVSEPIAVDLVPALRSQLAGAPREHVVELEPRRTARRRHGTGARVAGAVGLAAALIAGVVFVARQTAPVRVATRPAPAPLQLRAPGGASLLLAWTTGGLPPNALAHTRAIVGVHSVTEVRGGELMLTGERDTRGRERLHLPADAAIPLDALAVDPATYAREIPNARIARLVRTLPRNGALLGTTSARLRGIGVGGTLTFGATTVRVTGVVPDSLVGAAEVVLSDAGAVPIATPRFLLVAYRGDRSDLEHAIGLALHEPVRFRAPGEAPYLRQGDAVLPQALVKARFGEFWYRTGPGGSVTIDPAWVAKNIVTVDVPGLGPVRVHRLVAAALERAAARTPIHASGPVVGFALDAVTVHTGLSRHDWGIGIVIPGSGATRPATISALAAEGFRWGGLWLNRSPDYFEWVGAVAP
jgi:hypothetical protein